MSWLDKVLSENWHYDTDIDNMSGKQFRTAWILSKNSVNFDFPYQGEQHAILAIGKHRRSGNKILLKIEREQFMVSNITGEQVLVRRAVLFSNLQWKD
jgi:hypothetical protein